MKIIYMMSMIFFSFHVQADVYKCVFHSQVSYQEQPCPHQGAKFKNKPDISKQQQKAARERLATELKARDVEKRLLKEAQDKERVIKARELSARAAAQSARQAKQRNLQQYQESNNTNYIYLPIRRTRRVVPIRSIGSKPVQPILR